MEKLYQRGRLAVDSKG